MKFIVTFDLPEYVETSEHEVKLILMDALYEFVSHRGPTAEAYVEKRYANMWDEFRKDKVKQVNKRINVCGEMHNHMKVDLVS